jgi:hypothetical protein
MIVAVGLVMGLCRSGWAESANLNNPETAAVAKQNATFDLSADSSGSSSVMTEASQTLKDIKLSAPMSDKTVRTETSIPSLKINAGSADSKVAKPSFLAKAVGTVAGTIGAIAGFAAGVVIAAFVIVLTPLALLFGNGNENSNELNIGDSIGSLAVPFTLAVLLAKKMYEAATTDAF